MEGDTWYKVRCVTCVWSRHHTTNRDLRVERRDGRRAALAALLTRKHAGEDRQVRLIGLAASMYSPRFVNEALKVLGKHLIDDGRLDSVSLYSAAPTADFPELDTRGWQEDDYDQQGNLLDLIKVKEGKRKEIEWVLKQKLFDYVPQSECTERQGKLFFVGIGIEKQGRKGQSSIGRERDCQV